MRHSGDIMGAFILGMATGAAMMYITDPVVGRRRRALVRDKAVSGLHDAEDTLRRTGEDLRNRTTGTVAEMRGRMTEEHVDDQTLVDRVRSELGTVSTHPRAIRVRASDGCVFLEGDILRKEVDTVCRAVKSVRGVSEVRNNLQVHDDAGGLPQLQGSGRVAD